MRKSTAIAINRATLGAEHPHLISNLNTLASILRGKQDYAAAEPIFQEVLALRRKQLGDDHPSVSITLDSYAALLKAKGDYEHAERLQREAIAIARKAFGDEHRAIAITTGKLAGIIRATGDARRALPVYRDALARYERLLAPDHPTILSSHANVGACLIDLARYQEAETLLLPTYQTLQETQGPDHRLTKSALNYLVTLYEAWDKPDKAATYRALLPQDND